MPYFCCPRLFYYAGLHCDEIFGENNFIENYIWESTFRPDNSSPINRKNAEFILCYAKNKKCITRLIGGISSSDGLPSLTKNSMKESTLLITANSTETYLEDGVYLSGNKGNYVLLDDVIVKDGKIQNDFRLTGRMIWGQDYLDKQIKNGTKIVIKNDTFVPYTKKAEPTIQSPNKIIPKDRVSDILSANAERSQLFNTKVFDYPKPTSLLRYFLSFFETKNYTVLDYFSGSATTAHAVLQQNAEDDGQRKFIMVQLPEVCGEKSEAHKAGYKTICDIGEERIRRAGKKIKEETGADIDYGFRCFKVDSSNMKDVYYRPADIGQMEMDDLTDNIKEDRTPEDLLIQVMLDLGVLLSSKVEQTEIAGKKVFSVQDGYLIACFDKNVTEDVVTSIAKQHPFYAVFRDSSMADDSVAANFEQIFETYSPQTVRKVL
nr:DNA methyltransferase [Galactobacillus timonensis]